MSISTNIVGLRPVHDIITLYNRKHKGKAVMLSFIQHGNAEDGFKYEGVCVWCSSTTGYKDDKEDLLTYAQLFQELYTLDKEHRKNCLASGFHMKVYKTEVPLNTEKLIKEM